MVTDHLGTARLVTDAGANIIARHDYLPFGEEIAGGTAGRSSVWGPEADTVSHKFTGKERDSESGLDYFGARYYGSALGRMTSPDPSVLAFADLSNPQSLNLYAYVMNNPLSSVDPNGLDDEPCGGGGNVVASKGEGDDPCGGGVDPMPKTLPDQNCTKKDCQTDPVAEANDMGTVLGVLDHTRSCLSAALREVVASGETPGEPDNGYGTVVRGTVIGAPDPFASLIGTTNAHIDDPAALAGHPNILVQVNKNLQSTAFGRYQILNKSARGMGMTDFSAAGQDAYANSLLRSRGSVNAAAGGNFTGAMSKAGGEWASMPGSPYGQGGISLQSAAKTFLSALSSSSECR
jgi:RHS repeat-associated protein